MTEELCIFKFAPKELDSLKRKSFGERWKAMQERAAKRQSHKIKRLK